MTRDRLFLRVSVLAASAAVLLTAGCGNDDPDYRPWSETSTKASATTSTKTSAGKTSATKNTTTAPAAAADIPDPAQSQAPAAGGNPQVVAPTTTAAPVVTTTTTATTTTATTTTTTTTAGTTTTTTTQPVGQQLTQEICSAATSPAIKAACTAGGFTVTP